MDKVWIWKAKITVIKEMLLNNASEDVSGANFSFNSCGSSTFIFSNPRLVLFLGSLILKLLIGTVACGAHLLLFISAKRATALHVNVRILLCILAASAFVESFEKIENSLYGLFGYMIAGEKGWCIHWLLCHVAMLGLTTFAGTIMITVPLFIGIERTIATKQHRTYENCGKILGVTFGAISFFIGFLVVLVGVPGALQSSRSVYMEFCVWKIFVTGHNEDKFLSNLMTFVVIGLSQLFYVALLWRVHGIAIRFLKDFGANRVQLSLSSRLQLRHSVYITRTLMPALACIALGMMVRYVFV